MIWATECPDLFRCYRFVGHYSNCTLAEPDMQMALFLSRVLGGGKSQMSILLLVYYQQNNVDEE